MADLARALQTPVPATQPAPQQPASRTPAGPEPRASENPVQDIDAKRDAKNKRDQERRKAQRAAHAKAVEAALAKKKVVAKAKKKRKKKPPVVPPPVKKKARGRGRPPGSKNKPKPPLMDTVFPKATATPLAISNLLNTLTSLDPQELRAFQAFAALPTDAQRKSVLTAISVFFKIEL